MNRRNVLRVLGLWVALALVATGCGDDDEPAAGDGQTVERMAMLLPGKQDDQGYSQEGYNSLTAIGTALGIEIAVAESVDEAQQVEVYRDFASQGYDLVIGWGGQYTDGAVEAAAEFPNVFFAVGAGEGGNGSNYSSIDDAGEEWTFLIGYVAGKLTQTNKVGVVDGPCFEATAAGAHAFRDGALFANPDVEVIITGLDSFDDPGGAKEATLAQIAEGVDMVHAALNTGNFGVFAAAEENADVPVYVLTEFVDQSADAPTVALTAAIHGQTNPVGVIVDQIRNGSFNGQPILIPLTADDDIVAPFRDLGPQSLFDETLAIQAQIASGEIDVVRDGSCPYSGAP